MDANDLEKIFPSGARQTEQTELLKNIAGGVLQIAINTGGASTFKTFADLQHILREGLIDKYLKVGDQLIVDRLSSLSATFSGTGITAVSVDADTFEAAEGEAANRVYEFEFDGLAWKTDGNIVSLLTYGITVTGTPAEGDLIVVTETAAEQVFDVIGIDYDTPANSQYTHSLTLQTHDVVSYGEIPFSPKQAFYKVTEAIAANTVCKFSYPTGISAWGQVSAGEVYYFTPTAEIPVGAQLVFSGDIYSAKPTTMNVQVFTNGSDIDADATYSIANTGTEDLDLGPLDGEHCNHYQRCAYGANRFDWSISRQWGRSDAAGAGSGAVASWYAPVGPYDRPVVTTKTGFLHGIDPAFKAVLGAVKKRTAITPVGDVGGYKDTEETVFLLSQSEVFGSANNSVWETSFGTNNTIKQEAYPYWAARNTNADRIKYQGSTARRWWLRSPNPSYANYERFVFSDGSLSSYYALNSYGLAPACVIV